MKLNHFDNARQFYERVKSYLLQHEAEHNLMLGISDSLIRFPERFTDQPYLVAVQEDETLLTAALRTPPHKLVLSRSVNPQALNAIAQDLYWRQEQVPGVIGPVVEAKTFAEAWQAVTGQSYRQGMAHRIYQLKTVQPIPKASGYFRVATLCDRELLISWHKAFAKEARIDDIEQDAEGVIDRCLIQGTLYLWENNVPVSMANCAASTPHGACINLVYTPPEYRKKGYASSCVAFLSQTLLNQGSKSCFLFADLTNPTSNHIYQTIGYHPVCDVNDYWFY